MTSPIRYTISLPNPDTHLFPVHLRLPTEGRDAVELRLPVWSPGSYMVREYSRHIQRVTARVGEEPLRVRKQDKAAWRVDCAGVDMIEVSYEVFGHEIGIRMNHLDDSHGYINAPSLYLHPEGMLGRPVSVTFETPEGWSVFTGMERGEDGAFVADDYDMLYDMPVELGPHTPIVFDVLGARHEVVIWGRHNAESARLIADLTSIIEENAKLFGNALPYERYLFIVHTKPGGYGGLEHQNSTVLITTPHGFSAGPAGTSWDSGEPDDVYGRFLRLVSHEHFHTWHVKRIRPAVLGPFDYQRENYTRELWTIEGITSYYDVLMLVRAGMVKPKSFLKELATDSIQRLHGIPGRLVQSLEDASFDAWIKLYRPDEHSINSSVSYYLKGLVVALLLDLHLRAETDGARSLDDVMRALWAHYLETGGGYEEGSFPSWVERATGVNVEAFLADMTATAASLDLDATLGRVGLALVTKRTKEHGVHTGWRTKHSGDRVLVRDVLADSPAAEAGVYAGDELVAINSAQITSASLPKLLNRRAPGESATLHLFRRGALIERTITFAEALPDDYNLAIREDATPAQYALLEGWLGQTIEGSPAHEAWPMG